MNFRKDTGKTREFTRESRRHLSRNKMVFRVFRSRSYRSFPANFRPARQIRVGYDGETSVHSPRDAISIFHG